MDYEIVKHENYSSTMFSARFVENGETVAVLTKVYGFKETAEAAAQRFIKQNTGGRIMNEDTKRIMDKQTSDYRRAEFDKVQATADGFPRKIKIIAGDGGGTRWLNISDLEFECIDKLLVVGATKSKRERELEALVKISVKSEEYWRTQCELMAQKIDGLRYEIDTLEEHMETLVGVK